MNIVRTLFGHCSDIVRTLFGHVLYKRPPRRAASCPRPSPTPAHTPTHPPAHPPTPTASVAVDFNGHACAAREHGIDVDRLVYVLALAGRALGDAAYKFTRR